jgi:hypothetical protein
MARRVVYTRIATPFASFRQIHLCGRLTGVKRLPRAARGLAEDAAPVVVQRALHEAGHVEEQPLRVQVHEDRVQRGLLPGAELPRAHATRDKERDDVRQDGEAQERDEQRPAETVIGAVVPVDVLIEALVQQRLVRVEDVVVHGVHDVGPGVALAPRLR